MEVESGKESEGIKRDSNRISTSLLKLIKIVKPIIYMQFKVLDYLQRPPFALP
jgi:hypothetical protein